MITIGIAILLATGFAVSKICQQLRLPSVTGYILAGLLLGPTGLSIITRDTIGHNLDHFTQIALMLIAFGIGEHIEISKLKKQGSSLLWIAFFEALGAFLVVSVAIFFTIRFTGFTVAGWDQLDYLTLCLLLGSIGIATAPAATLLVIRELRAKGPLTSTLMAIVAIDDGLAIMIFGLMVSISHQLQGYSGDPLLVSVGSTILEIAGSLLLGLVIGIVLIQVLSRLKHPGELMTAGLAILMLCGEAALYFHLSPLLAGMTAGFYLVNKEERDVRVFRALNAFEPPIYVLFFTLAGTHLDFDSLRTAGLIGIIYFLSTVTGKVSGIAVGARIAGSEPQVRRYLGFTMVPQAGVAIGLIFLLSSDSKLETFATVITPVVLAGVFLSELIGPLSARYALTKAGENNLDSTFASDYSEFIENGTDPASICILDETFRLIPWSWAKLPAPENSTGLVIFHAVESLTARGLARTATILAAYYQALPMAVRINTPGSPDQHNFHFEEQAEVESMGYRLNSELIDSPDIETGIIEVVKGNDTKAVVLGYPLKRSSERFRRLLESVAQQVECPVAVVRFKGELHTEHILIPLTEIEELTTMRAILEALDEVGDHRLQLLYMMSSTAEEKDIKNREQQIQDYLKEQEIKVTAAIRAVATDSRLDTIEQAAEHVDLVVMAAPDTGNVERLLFGSLVDSVAAKLPKTLLVVYNSGKFQRSAMKVLNPGDTEVPSANSTQRRKQ